MGESLDRAAFLDWLIAMINPGLLDDIRSRDHLIMYALAVVESDLVPDAVGDNGHAHGLWQMHDAYHDVKIPEIYTDRKYALGLAYGYLNNPGQVRSAVIAWEQRRAELIPTDSVPLELRDIIPSVAWQLGHVQTRKLIADAEQATDLHPIELYKKAVARGSKPGNYRMRTANYIDAYNWAARRDALDLPPIGGGGSGSFLVGIVVFVLALVFGEFD